MQSYGLRKRVEAVKNCRSIGKKDMKYNNTMPRMKVDQERYVRMLCNLTPFKSTNSVKTVEADGRLCEAEPATEVPLAQSYFFFEIAEGILKATDMLCTKLLGIP